MHPDSGQLAERISLLANDFLISKTQKKKTRNDGKWDSVWAPGYKTCMGAKLHELLYFFKEIKRRQEFVWVSRLGNTKIASKKTVRRKRFSLAFIQYSLHPHRFINHLFLFRPTNKGIRLWKGRKERWQAYKYFGRLGKWKKRYYIFQF